MYNCRHLPRLPRASMSAIKLHAIVAILIRCLSEVVAGELRSETPTSLGELSTRPGAKNTTGSIADFDSVDYLPILGPFRHRRQQQLEPTAEHAYEFGQATGGIRIGISPVKIVPDAGVSISIVARLENSSASSIYFLDPDGTEHPFEIIMVTPNREAYHLAAPIADRMMNWRRLSGAFIEAGNAVEFSLTYNLSREASVSGQYLLYAVAQLPKGATQEARTLWSQNMLFKLTPEHVQKIKDNTDERTVRQRASPAAADLTTLQAARQRAGVLSSGAAPAKTVPTSDKSATKTSHSWPSWVVAGLLTLILAVLLKGMLTRRKDS